MEVWELPSPSGPPFLQQQLCMGESSSTAAREQMLQEKVLPIRRASEPFTASRWKGLAVSWSLRVGTRWVNTHASPPLLLHQQHQPGLAWQRQPIRAERQTPGASSPSLLWLSQETFAALHPHLTCLLIAAISAIPTSSKVLSSAGPASWELGKKNRDADGQTLLKRCNCLPTRVVLPRGAEPCR